MPVPAVVRLGGGDVERAVIGTVAGRRAHRAGFVPAHLAKHGAVQLGACPLSSFSFPFAVVCSKIVGFSDQLPFFTTIFV